MKLALLLGYWAGHPPADTAAIVAEAERLGFDAVFTAESYGSDAFTPLAWWGSQTSRLKLGTSVAQISARTPTATAMAALTLDHLSGGRAILGLGVSNPQVVEGWYGQPFAQPLARTREYVDVIRQVFARQAPVTSPGPHYPLPHRGTGALGAGKPLKPNVHPLRAGLPIWLGVEGPKSVALCAEIADGWLTGFFAPRVGEIYRSWLKEGFARPGARRAPDDFEISACCSVVVTNDTDAALDALKPGVGFYVGGMGARHMNFHKDVFVRMGYEREAEQIQALFLEGKRDEAIAAVPRQAVADISLVGSPAQIRDELSMWEEAGVTMLVFQSPAPDTRVFGTSLTSLDQIRNVAEVILGV